MPHGGQPDRRILQCAEVTIEHNTMLAPFGLEHPDVAPLVHFSPRVDVVVWGRERVG